MRFTIVQQTGVPHQTVDFLPPGGTIGRSQDNDLVLPDEARAISRLQAVVHISPQGECRLTNRGSVTTVVLNGRPLDRDSQVLLQHGDTLTIGEYQIEVRDPRHETVSENLASSFDPLSLFQQHALADDPLGLAQHDTSPLVTSTLEPAAAESTASRSNSHSSARLDIDPLPRDHSERTESAAPCSDGRLIQALLDGMGLDNHGKEGLTEEQMRMTGRMLSLFSQGTVALLSSRSILKRGVKAEMTMILNEANNPFKILPSGKTVLMQMYQSQMPGFMQPEQAVRDALVDLQAHQLGMIAGIRAIIAAMLQSFNPQRLEDNARQDGQLPKMRFTAHRKAALWDYFIRSYQRTAGELEDDFHSLFGEAFLHAYDMEVNQYKDSQTRMENE
ncbi:type VI secretion system-associated FHA domain protein TagH [Erwinia sp. PK3-005]|uniref:Type VI secretion system-associated FHA domain protein TagH n=1 Tax=Mixta hanseatica TaxID=2872648 RepID=A0ABY4RE90_9GAMM|nr:type VI secretion system-associated FHA domain protein TagH [Mixta hanseatica]UQY45857.1 type VI secretion system-associated FHA domain protein TagH [Mixta hanseatica]